MDVLVNLVARDEDAWVCFQDLAQLHELLPRIAGACRVRRAVEEQEARLRRDGFFELPGRDKEPAVDISVDNDWFGFREPDHVRIRYPVRCRYDGFVAGPEDCLARVETGLLGAARYQDLRRLVVKRIVAGKFGLYRTL